MSGSGRKQTEKVVVLSLTRGPLTSAKQTLSAKFEKVCCVPEANIGFRKIHEIINEIWEHLVGFVITR
jgi:hypothetical protein